METLHFSIAEGKKNFSKIIKASGENKQRIIISRRGIPVAIILPYEEYKEKRKMEALKEIQELRAVYQKAEISAQKVHKISREELEQIN